MKIRVLTAGLALMIAGTALAQPTPSKPETKPDAPKTTPAPKEQPKKDEAKKDEKTLKVGDKAPPLTIEKWVKGEPVTGFEKGKIYVVEFWATWCGPCMMYGVPHMTEKQKELKDKGVTIIGVDIWEDAHNRGAYSDETLKTVTGVVEKQGERMSYTIGYDGGTKKMDKDWMQSSGRSRMGIPSAFIVSQEGLVVWMGNPIDPDDGFDRVLDELTTGKFDLKAEPAKREAAQKAKAEREAAMQNWATLWQSKEYDKAYPAMTELAEKYYKNDATALNMLAWRIVDPQTPIEKPNLDVAMKLASRSVEIKPSWENLDTLARVYFLKGDLAKAIELQKKAVEKVKSDKGAPEGSTKEIEDNLKEYEAAKSKK